MPVSRPPAGGAVVVVIEGADCEAGDVGDTGRGCAAISAMPVRRPPAGGAVVVVLLVQFLKLPPLPSKAFVQFVCVCVCDDPPVGWVVVVQLV